MWAIFVTIQESEINTEHNRVCLLSGGNWGKTSLRWNEMRWKKNQCGFFGGERDVRLTISENCVRVCWLPHWLIGGGDVEGWHGYCCTGDDIHLPHHNLQVSIVSCLMKKTVLEKEAKKIGRLTLSRFDHSVEGLLPLFTSLYCLCSIYHDRDKKYKWKIMRHHMAQLQAAGAIFGPAMGK